MSNEKGLVDSLLQEAQNLLTQRPGGAKNELEQQQYQQLRIVCSDLKATYEKVGYRAVSVAGR